MASALLSSSGKNSAGSEVAPRDHWHRDFRRHLSRHRFLQIFVSDDAGASWRYCGGNIFKDSCINEHSVMEKQACQFLDEVKTGPQRSFCMDGCVGWVSIRDDTKQGRPGQYDLRLLPSLGGTGYPGLHQLPDGITVASVITVAAAGVLAYGYKHLIVGMRIMMSEVAARMGKARINPAFSLATDIQIANTRGARNHEHETHPYPPHRPVARGAVSTARGRCYAEQAFA